MDIFQNIQAGKYRNELPYALGDLRGISTEDRAMAMSAYREETTRLEALFRIDLLANIGLAPGPAAEALYAYAWDHAHSAGYSEVAIVAREAAELLKAGAREERTRIRQDLRTWADEFVRRGAYLDGFLEALDWIAPEEG